MSTPIPLTALLLAAPSTAPTFEVDRVEVDAGNDATSVRTYDRAGACECLPKLVDEWKDEEC